jgi:DNA-binding NtrC family response regulator
MQTQKVLVVDDDPGVRTMLSQTLDRSGYDVQSAVDGSEALCLIKDNQFNLVITDIRLPKVDGLQLLEEIKQSTPQLPVIVITGYGSVQNAVEAMQFGASDYLLKPFSTEALQAAISRSGMASIERPFIQQNQRQQSSDRQIVTQDRQFLNILKVAENVASSSASVLIQGESGTGKELLARHIHESGGRKNDPYVAVNCAALPDTLAESELFGHEKGAFTGAIQRKVGKFEAAGNGSIVLDEISEMAMPLQAKLLRVLQERQVERIGSNRLVEVNARVIAISNVDLKASIEAGKFRKDLFYRVNVVPLRVPALRERRDDIPLLSSYFCETFCHQNNKALMSISQSAEQMMRQYSWPGNVRELENAMERAVLISNASEIRAEDLILDGDDLCLESPRTSTISSGLTVREMERKLIMATMQTVNENRSQAAEMLGISIRTLRNKLKEYREAN